MDPKQPFSRAQAIRAILEHAEAPLTFDELLAGASALFPMDANTLKKGLNNLANNSLAESDFWQWLTSQQAKPGDALLFKMQGGATAHCSLTFEARTVRDESCVSRRNGAVAESAFSFIKSRRRGARLDDIAARLLALGMYHDPCPPDSLETVIKNDARFRWKHGELTKATRYDSLYSALGLEETDLLDLFEEKPRKKPRRGSRHNESAQQVYRFRAALRHDKTLWRLIEIRGNQSLRVLDQEMRAAFGHDSSDHLSEFYLGVDADARRRGLGMHVPFEKGEGDAWLVGELGLVEGDELSYTYDFGDNIQHVLQLKAVIPPEPRVKYPRIVEQNKPRYHYCPVCKQEGKKEIATWICIDCSNDEQRNVLICQDHVTLDHKDHYIQEITY